MSTTIIARTRHIDIAGAPAVAADPYRKGARVMFDGRLSRVAAVSDRPGIITVENYAGRWMIGTSHSRLAPAEQLGYGPELAAAVEAGRISFRRAEALTESKIDGGVTCPLHGAGCEAWS